MYDFVFVKSECPKNCIGGICDKSTGKCDCKDGFYGQKCNNGKHFNSVWVPTRPF